MAFLAYALLDEIEDRERNKAFTLHKYVLRDKCNSFDLSDFNFEKLYRLYRLTKNEHFRPSLTKIRKNSSSVKVQVPRFKSFLYLYALILLTC